MNILESTRAYEQWLGNHVELVVSDLRFKHQMMADRDNPFPFFRATFYRWLELWQTHCPELAKAPRCNAIGDLHIENFGTWRDGDGRLAWGVNDFDEADDYPYTIDLVRLAASAGIARTVQAMRNSLSKACRAIEFGYRKQLESGGRPMLLEEKNRYLRELAHHQEREPSIYWKKMTLLLDDAPIFPTKELKDLLKSAAPQPLTAVEFRRRPKVGLGSLGKPRFVMIAKWNGSWITREAKALVPSALAWHSGIELTSETPKSQSILASAFRSPDPVLHYGKDWVCRRLAPYCGRIELGHIVGSDEQIRLLAAMGQEVANVHLGSGKKISEVKKHLAKLPEGWLMEAATKMSAAVTEDWQIYCARARRKTQTKVKKKV